MHRQALKVSEKVLGPEHPDTLTSISNLGSVLESQGKYEKAEAMFRQTLTISERVLGREHSNVLMSVYRHAHMLANRYRYSKFLIYMIEHALHTVSSLDRITQSPVHVTNIVLRLSLRKIGLGLCLLLQKRIMAQVYTAERSRGYHGDGQSSGSGAQDTVGVRETAYRCRINFSITLVTLGTFSQLIYLRMFSRISVRRQVM